MLLYAPPEKPGETDQFYFAMLRQATIWTHKVMGIGIAMSIIIPVNIRQVLPVMVRPPFPYQVYWYDTTQPGFVNALLSENAIL